MKPYTEFVGTPQTNERASILLLYSCAMDKWGGPIAFAGFGAADNKGIAFGGFSASGSPIAFGTFCMIPMSYGIRSLSP